MPVEAAAETSRRAGLEESFAHCERLTRAHAENFPVGWRLAPRSLRPHVHAIYAFARIADDLADEGREDGGRLERLRAWEDGLNRCLRGEAAHPVFVALGDTIRRFELPDRPFRDLLDAFRQDCVVRRYGTFRDLEDYCRRSANPIGRLVLLVYGRREEDLARLSGSVCTALQLTNFWQDVTLDLDKDRIYLPEEDRARHGVTEADLVARRDHPGQRALILDLVARTRTHFERGRPLLRRIGGRLGLELRVVWLGGLRILSKIEAAGGDVLGRRPVLGRGDRAGLLVSALVGRGAW